MLGEILAWSFFGALFFGTQQYCTTPGACAGALQGGGGIRGSVPAPGKFSKNEAKSCILTEKSGFRAPKNPYGARACYATMGNYMHMLWSMEKTTTATQGHGYNGWLQRGLRRAPHTEKLHKAFDLHIGAGRTLCHTYQLTSWQS